MQVDHTEELQLISSIEVWLGHAERNTKHQAQAYWEAYHYAIELKDKLHERYKEVKQKSGQS